MGISNVKSVDDEKFSFKKGIGYSIYAALQSMVSVFVGYLTYYATDSLYLSAASVGMILAFSRVFDGITDIIAGIIIDKTNTKYGKARPYILCGSLAYFFMALMFATPNLPNVGKLIWIFITYNLNVSAFGTIYNILNATLLRRIFVKQDNRVKVLSYSGIITNIGTTVVNVILPIVVAKTAEDSKYWTYMAITLGVAGIALTVLAFLLCEEYTEEELVEYGVITEKEVKEKVPLKTMLTAIIKNKYFIYYLIAYVVMALMSGITYTVQTYYFAVSLGDITIFSTVSMLAIVFWPLYLVYPKFMRKAGVTKFVQFFMVLGVVGSLARYVIGANVVLLTLSSWCTSMVMGVVYMVGPEVTIQCMNYSSLKNGIKVESIYNSVVNFVNKLGLAIGAALLGVVLTKFGYDGALAVQPDSAITTINFMMNAVPAICAAVMFFMFSICKVEKANEKLREEKKQQQ